MVQLIEFKMRHGSAVHIKCLQLPPELRLR